MDSSHLKCHIHSINATIRHSNAVGKAENPSPNKLAETIGELQNELLYISACMVRELAQRKKSKLRWFRR